MSLKKTIPFLLLGLILAFAFWARFNAFWLPHWKGDQSHYAALAMKLDTQGLNGYNLREINLGALPVSKQPPIEIIFFRPGPPGDTGDILRVLSLVGQSYYDEPLHYRAPLFSYALMWSHRIFAHQEKFYAACTSNLGEQVKKLKPAVVLKAQFWCAIVPLAFNLGVIVMTFFLARRYFGNRVALWAAFLMASNPLSVVLAHRLLVEDMLAFFVTLAVFLFLEYFGKKNPMGIIAAGVAAGLAVLSKQTAVLLVGVVWIYAFLSRRNTKKFAANIFNPEPILFAAAALAVSGFWFLKVYSVFGNPLHTAGSVYTGMSKDVTGWFRSVSHRPPPLIFFSFGVLFLSPLFGFAFLTFRDFWRKLEGVQMMLWVWVLMYFVFLVEPWHVLELVASQEHRFFYMAYPAIAILAALGMDRARIRWSDRVKIAWFPDAAMIVLLGLNAWWGIPQAMKVLFQNNMLF